MIRKAKQYSRPRKPFEKTRIEEENKLAKTYALKNKKEIWKTIAKIEYFRKRAMSLANESQEERSVFINKLKDLGLNVNNTADILGLKVEDLLERRLPTIVFKKKLANTTKQARQMVTHKRVWVEGRIVNVPSYLVPVEKESKITVKEIKVNVAPSKQEATVGVENE